MKKIAILQSNYIPWKGYFDIINMVDEFILYDDVQYTKNDWRNRNKIKTPNGVQWLTIPTRHEMLSQKIKNTRISYTNWNKKHWKSFITNYSKAKYFKEYKDIFEDAFLNCNEIYLSQINFKFITLINDILGITTQIRFSSEFNLIDGKSERLLGICKDCNADIYLSGPSAKGYLDEDIFQREGISVEWMDYSNYPKYHQLYPPFRHDVTILDLIFNEGKNSQKFMKSFSATKK